MQPNLGDLVTSWIRTGAALLVGALITWGIRQGFLADSSAAQPLTELLVFVCGTVYYVVVRALEHHWPQFGFFLGIPKAPAYSAPARVGGAGGTSTIVVGSGGGGSGGGGSAGGAHRATGGPGTSSSPYQSGGPISGG